MPGDRKADQALLAAAAWQKRQLAEDLHEGVCQTLAGISLLISTFLRRIRSGKRVEEAELERIGKYLEEAIDQGRAPLRAQSLSREPGGLAQALSELARRTSSRAPCELLFLGKTDFPDGRAAFALYLIAHEAVRNALRHGHVGKITISLGEKDGRRVLEVRDDGVGFVPVAGGTKWRGVNLMRHFARAIGGILRIDSAPGAGTAVRCALDPQAPERKTVGKRKERNRQCLVKQKSGPRKSPRPATRWT